MNLYVSLYVCMYVCMCGLQLVTYLQCGSHISSGVCGNIVNCYLQSIHMVIVVTTNIICGLYITSIHTGFMYEYNMCIMHVCMLNAYMCMCERRQQT